MNIEKSLKTRATLMLVSLASLAFVVIETAPRVRY
jgi:hypothetical protein